MEFRDFITKKSDDILRKFSNVDWTMFTPPPILDAEGPESNDYVLGNMEPDE